MVVKSSRELGLALRDRRKRTGLSQAELAAKIGTTRQWVSNAERGADSVELGLVLRAAAALGLVFDIGSGAPPTRGRQSPKIDIDAIVSKAKDQTP